MSECIVTLLNCALAHAWLLGMDHAFLIAALLPWFPLQHCTSKSFAHVLVAHEHHQCGTRTSCTLACAAAG